MIYNAHNLESAFRREARAAGDAAERPDAAPLRARACCERASESWMVSRKDMDGALELAPDTPVRLVPNVVDVTAMTPVAPAARRPRILLVATSLAAEPRGAREFLAESVLPRVWQRLPETRG